MTTERPWLDVSLCIDHRVDLLIAEMSLDELVGQCVQVGNVDLIRDAEALRAGRISSSLSASGPHAGNERDAGVTSSVADAVQRLAVEESRLGVPLLFGRDVIHGHRTVFPIPLGQAAGWDEALVAEAAAIAAAEAASDGVAWTFAPMADICEDGRWGRIAEGFGEAPVLSGRLAAAAVRGFQGEAPREGIPAGRIVTQSSTSSGTGWRAAGATTTPCRWGRTPSAMCICVRSGTPWTPVCRP